MLPLSNALSAIVAFVSGLFAQDPTSTDALNAQAAAQSQAVAYQAGVLGEADRALFRQGLASARARDVSGTYAVANQIGDATARKLVIWALIDTSADRLSYDELARARRDYADWPRAESRITAGELALDRGYASSELVMDFFGDAQPQTAQGMIAKATALRSSGREPEARALVQDWWRNHSFESAEQSRVLSLFGDWLTTADHDQRLNMLLLGPQGPATRAMIPLASTAAQADADARMRLRTAYDFDGVVAGLSPELAIAPGVALERVRQLRTAKRESEGFALLSYLPPAPLHSDGQDLMWTERRNYFIDALQAGNSLAAYHAMAGHGFPSGARKVDAEFWAGWAALVKLNDPVRAAQHFETLRQSSSTPITQGRALYWLGRAAEAQGDTATAQARYAEGARHIQSFYGQLSAERAGMTTITLPADPVITDEERAAFEANEVVRAARILGESGEASLLRVFAYHLDDTLPSPAQLGLLMDMARGYGEGFTAMMVGRAASQRGWLLPERQYPIRIPPSVEGAAPLEFTLAITRQESSFDPRARSHADARGMMQFLPATGRTVARQVGVPFDNEKLWDPDFNMMLGSYHLGDLTRRFGGSPLLATIGYNAGPGRPAQWIPYCGDPRGGQTDPVDFIECAPFTETRDYMMRVMENMQIYRARLNNGTGALTLSEDIRRGYSPGQAQPYYPE